MAEKLKLKIIKVEDEENLDESITYIITLQSKRGSYVRGIQASDWEDERAQRSIKKTWLRDIGRIEAEKAIKETKTKEEIKAELKANMKGIKGTVLEEDE